MSARIGILGGTFDPIHYGHLAIAEDVRVSLQLDTVLFVPAARQPLKSAGHVATPEQRYDMVALAISGNAAFQSSAIELSRPGPSYTVTTLEQLQAAGLGELHFILGADALGDLPRWHAVPRILELARMVVVKRPGIVLDLAALIQNLPQLSDRLAMIEGPRLEISSTELRRRIFEGRTIRYLTPDPVIEYIARHKLYLGSARGAPAQRHGPLVGPS